MKIHRIFALIVASVGLSASACADLDEDSTETSSREVYFDGAEIKAVVERDQDVTFFADVRDGAIIHFDQSEEAIDFSNFVLQCPSMTVPVPMENILEHFDEDAYSSEYWSIQAADSGSESELAFRKLPQCARPPIGCACECPGGGDCLLVCVEF